MTGLPSMFRTLLAAMAVVAVASSAMAIPVDLGFPLPCYTCGFGLNSELDRLIAIRDCLAKFRRPDDSFLKPGPEGWIDLELPSLLAQTQEPVSGSWSLTLTSSQAILQFKSAPCITLADVQTTEYDPVVIRQLRTCCAWKREADSLLLESLSGVDDSGFFTVIEWYMKRQVR